MRALRLTRWRSDAEVVDTEDPEPGPGQVVIRVGGSGACHSDLHIMREFGDDTGGPWPLPFTLGHENAGWVHALGPGVKGLEIGEAVAVQGAWGCGTCARCRIGMDNYCENPMGAPVPGGGCGLGTDGGMAEYLLIPDARYLIPLPDGLDPLQAAPLTDAGLTPYHAIRRSWDKLGPDSAAVVIGAGGLGHLAVQILRQTTATKVIALDTKPEALDLAASLGAEVCVTAGDQAVAQVRDATGGRGADVVLDFVGSEATLQSGLGCVRTLGDVTLVGIAGGSVPFGFFTVPYEASLQSTYWGSREELVELLALAGRGLVRAQVTTFALEDAMKAYRSMEAGTLEGRAVVVPQPA